MLNGITTYKLTGKIAVCWRLTTYVGLQKLPNVCCTFAGFCSSGVNQRTPGFRIPYPFQTQKSEVWPWGLIDKSYFHPNHFCLLKICMSLKQFLYSGNWGTGFRSEGGEFWPPGGLSPKFAQNRCFPHRIASKLHDFEKKENGSVSGASGAPSVHRRMVSI